MKDAVIYIHGKGGSANEAEHYAPLFANCDVIGFDYKSTTPWEAMKEYSFFYDVLQNKYKSVSLICNSIGAFFAMVSLYNKPITKAYFISPIVDMQKLIEKMMSWAKVSESNLEKEKFIETSFGETLSWDYYLFAKQHPVNWNIKTYILYGENDTLTDRKTINNFAGKTNATLTIMKDGEHWFHTKQQIKFLDKWVKNCNQL